MIYEDKARFWVKKEDFLSENQVSYGISIIVQLLGYANIWE